MSDKNGTDIEEFNTIILEDSEGTEMFFEEVALVELEGAKYSVLLPAESEGADDDEYTILRLDENGDYIGISDYDELMRVFDRFCELYDDKEKE